MAGFPERELTTAEIEAAMLARRMAPGRHRSFAFQAWPSLPSPPIATGPVIVPRPRARKAASGIGPRPGPS